MTPAEIVGLIAMLLTSAGIGGIVAAYFNSRAANKKVPSEIKATNADTEKTEAETADILVKAAGAAVNLVIKGWEEKIQTVTRENDALRCDVAFLRSENTTLKETQARHEQQIGELQMICEQFDEVLNGAHDLYNQVIGLKVEPKYKPPDRRKK